MSDHDDEPTRADSALATQWWPATKARAEALRRRRRMLAAGGASVLVLLLVAGTAAVAAPRSPSLRVELTAPSTTVASAPTSSTIPPPIVPSTTIPATIPSTTMRTVPPSTSLAPTTTTSSTSTSTTTVPYGQCDQNLFAQKITTDRRSYTKGQVVHITLTITNTGPPCFDAPGPGACGEDVQANDAAGQPVWENWAGPGGLVPGGGCVGNMEDTPHGWSASIDLTWSQDRCDVYQNGQDNCPETQVPTGSYTLETVTENAAPPVTITIS